ncbi:heat-inducible transcriptional repressor HrcA [Acidipropionibacterium virtanenii]|uniref:Heat-inducible transcription repressor HrcA n=1 Tax=Acidipropionibacterium virtanenii TaxID=2057246 RepID=A0A344UUY2_9ACTN|nr:heat-inducible transcriptional repressor HrcA [Acidipropionibacterium virtanenii]AXE39080.1 Heat-inducible transcription repressor HrcA [Acidipropionibacterium virtanenii]
MLDDRKLDVLKAIVTDYVSSKEPVGSKALVERHGLRVSPATVRNDMAALEEEGYITHPHTSAGRIPTDKGYRLFVDRIATVKPLSAPERRAIMSFMNGAADLDDIVTRTVRLLAQITHQVAIMQYPVASSATVLHLELVSLSTDRVLVVLITSSGTVEQRIIDMPGHTERFIVGLRSRLNDLLVGCTIAEAAEALAGFIDEFGPDSSAAVSGVAAAVLEILATDPSARVVVAGVPNLAGFGMAFETSVRPVLEALEEQVVLLRLLGEATSSGAEGLTVRIGTENPDENFRSTSLVASTYGDDGGRAGLGVVGPTRMDYPSTMAAVRAIARYVGRFLSEG